MTKRTVTTATRKRADRLASQLRGTEVEQNAAELAEWARQSEALAKAQSKAEALAKARAKTEALAAKAQDKAEMLATQAQRTGTELATKAQTRSTELADQGLHRLGERLSRGRSGKMLGIRRRWRPPPWLLLLGGSAGGYAIWRLAQSKCGRLSGRARSTGAPLAETIRSELTNDPRTAELPDLDVNVADGIVFVRGTVPPGFRQDTLREVIARVPGVHDVDLQVTAV